MLQHRFFVANRSVYTLSDMARDSVGLLDALGLSAAHVVGARRWLATAGER